MLRNIILAIVLVALSGCDTSLNMSVSSGTIDNSYIEEPLSGIEEKYENALTRSNLAVEYMISDNYSSMYQELFDENLRSMVTENDFVAKLSEIKFLVGNIEEYKKMQWAFFPKEESGIDYLHSIKLVKHEKSFVKYTFVFLDDEEYGKIVGVNIIPVKSTSLLGQ